MKTIHTIIISCSLILIAQLLMGSSCEQKNPGEIAGYSTKVAKVDTQYVYEGNVAEFVASYKQSRRSSTSNFLGFSPDVILAVREQAIDNGIREEIKRFPGVEIRQSDVRELASRKAEDLAWEVYFKLVDEGANFESMALEYSNHSSRTSGGLLEPFGLVDHPSKYQGMAYDMSVGEISKPFYSDEGWRIIKLEEIKDADFGEKLYSVRLIQIQPDVQAAEAEILDGFAVGHRIEVIDHKYVAHLALIEKNYQKALDEASKAIERNKTDDLAHYLKSKALWNLDRKEEAVESLKVAAENGTVSDGFIPYYHFYRADYLEQLGRVDEAKEVYRLCFDTMMQNISIARSLEPIFERLGDEEYLAKVREEIRIIEQNDLIVAMWGRGGGTPGIIVTGEGVSTTGSFIYKPRYRGSQ